MKNTMRQTHQFSSEKIYKFGIGNSTSGPIGAVFDIVAANEHKALDRVRSVLEDVCMGIDLSDAFANRLRSPEYCRVYPNSAAIGLEHIEMMYGPTTDEVVRLPSNRPQETPGVTEGANPRRFTKEVAACGGEVSRGAALDDGNCDIAVSLFPSSRARHSLTRRSLRRGDRCPYPPRQGNLGNNPGNTRR